MTAERTYCSEVWCCRWEHCRGVFVPGYSGGGQAMLCEACNAEQERAQRLPAARDARLAAACEACELTRAQDAPPAGTVAVTTNTQVQE